MAELSEREQRILALAERQWQRDGEIELNDNDSPADISEGDDNGAYVRAWVWVSFEGTPLDKGEDEAEGEGEDEAEGDDTAAQWIDAPLQGDAYGR
jgi:hypothetical protein